MGIKVSPHIDLIRLSAPHFVWILLPIKVRVLADAMMGSTLSILTTPETQGTTFQDQGHKILRQRTTIPLPSDALVEVFAFLPRTDRIRLALLNRQVAPILVPGLMFEVREDLHPS